MSAIEEVIKQHQSLVMSHLEYEDRSLSELRNEQATAELAAKDAVIEAAREYMEVMEAIGGNSDNAVRQSYIELLGKFKELDGMK